MELKNFLYFYIFWLFILGMPFLAMVLVKPNSPQWQKTAKLLVPIALFVVLVNSTLSFKYCLPFESVGCVMFSGFLYTIMTFEYIAFLGLYEFIWRVFYRQFSWNLKENLKFGIISNLTLIISLLFVVWFFCKLYLK